MFRMGGTAEGITSGLQPSQGYQGTDNPSDQRVQPSRSRNFNDFLIGMGLDLVSRPTSGNIFADLASSAKGPFKEFQATRAAGEERDYQKQLYDEKFAFEKEKFGEQKKQFGQELEQERYLGELDAKGEKEFIVEQINNYWDPLIEAETNEIKKKELEDQKRSDTYNVIVLGEDISDKYKILSNSEAYEIANDNARGELESQINPATGTNWARGDVGYSEKLQVLINKYLRLATKFLEPDKKADGGRIGYQNAGAVMPEAMPMNQEAGPTDQGETNEINISYEQLRDRLPQEISNEIVLLLSESYEAFADFAEIQTQSDVNEFNTKYNVQLFLPKQSGA
ncbi:hypothetical protein HOK09_03130 [Candidatus Woesearchaeota archaeon]|nr:hypothetical protein [Candidatus Woesearchaeota archaeon]